MKPKRLRDVRRAAKLTQAQLAQAIGRPQSFISKLESGAVPRPTFADVVAIAGVLDVEPTTLEFGPSDRATA